MKNNMIKVPKTMWNKNLPMENDNSSKKRRCKVYLVESLIFSCIVLLIDSVGLVFNETIDTVIVTKSKALNITIVLVLTFILAFVISYILDYFVSEHSVKKYNKKIDK